MKKSAYIAKLEQRLGLLAAQMAAAATEEAGVVWDPEEEEPLAEKLYADKFGELADVKTGRYLTVREKREIIRRWNAFERVRALAFHGKQGTAIPAWCCSQILAILDGKEGE